MPRRLTPIVRMPYRVESKGPSAPRPRAPVVTNASTDHGSQRAASETSDACIGSTPVAKVHVSTRSKQEPLSSREVVEERCEVADALCAGEPFARDRVLLGPKDGEVPPCPACSLEEEGREIVRREALNENFVVVIGPPPLRMHCDRGVEILRDRVGEHASDILERAAPDERGGTAPEHRVAPALPGGDDLVEQGLFVTLRPRVLDRVAVREIVRSLHERDVWICEVPNRGVENLREAVHDPRPGRARAHPTSHRARD